MLFKDTYLLEKAYLSISQPMATVPSDEEVLPMNGEEGIEPEIETGLEGSSEEIGMHNPEVEMNPHDEAEEDTMSVDNLNSIRESSMKIAQYWATGGHLEPWQQQKLAIVMNSLAEIARSLR